MAKIKFTKEQREKVKSMIISNISYRDIEEKTGISKNYIKQIAFKLKKNGYKNKYNQLEQDNNQLKKQANIEERITTLEKRYNQLENHVQAINNGLQEIKSLLSALMQSVEDVKIFLTETDAKDAPTQEKDSLPINDAPQTETPQAQEELTQTPTQDISPDEIDRMFDDAARETAQHNETTIQYIPIQRQEMTQEELELFAAHKDEKSLSAIRKLICILDNSKLMAKLPEEMKSYLIRNYQYLLSRGDTQRKMINYLQYYDTREMGKLVDALREYWTALHKGLIGNNQQLTSETASYIFYYAQQHGTNFNLQ